jgi:hypothetical protein
MDVKDHLSLAKLKQLARAEKDAKLSKRMQMVVLALGSVRQDAHNCF